MKAASWRSAFDPLRLAARADETFQESGLSIRLVMVLFLWPTLLTSWLLRRRSEKKIFDQMEGSPD